MPLLPRYITFLLSSILWVNVYAQKKPAEKETYGIGYNPQKLGKACIECLQNLQVMPTAVHFGLYRIENELVFVMNDRDWFNKIFDDNDDAIAVDVIRRNQFPCRGRNDYDESKMVKGTMTPPVYKKSLHRGAITMPDMDVVVKVGDVPAHLASESDLEFNLMIIKNDQLCYYVAFYDLPTTKLELLHMDLFMDSLSTDDKTGGAYTYRQHLEFTVPFEKNKSEYKPEDIKSLTDSLHLNKYNIKSVKIRAYSSVEGLESKNVELQQKRAESLVKSLQSFQNVPIAEEVTASENWVEFLSEIAFTKYSSLKLLSKQEIKAELEKKQVAIDLEPLLKAERKGMLYIELERKSNYKNLSEEDIKKQFAEAIQKKNIQEAKEIQNAIFQNVDSKKYSPKLVQELEVPEEKTFGGLLLNQLVYNFNTNPSNTITALDKMTRLRDMMPDKPLLDYNLSVLEIRLFLESELLVDRAKVLKNIHTLESKKIDSRLVRRLKINYHIILCDYLTKEKKYSEREKALNYIYLNYKNMQYDDEDLVRLAKYFSAYNKYDWALKLIENRATALNVSEDLLFYYINLTITVDANTKKPTYRTILANAYNTNPSRFCALFGTAHLGGVSFQLLKNLFLRKNFCENCETQIQKL